MKTALFLVAIPLLTACGPQNREPASPPPTREPQSDPDPADDANTSTATDTGTT